MLRVVEGNGILRHTPRRFCRIYFNFKVHSHLGRYSFNTINSVPTGMAKPKSFLRETKSKKKAASKQVCGSNVPPHRIAWS